MKTLQWIHNRIIQKQKGPIYLNYSCLSPEGVRKITVSLWSQETILKVGQKVVKRVIYRFSHS